MKYSTTTIELISQKFTYARYTPLLYLKKGLDQLEEQSQRNMGKFMKILLVKRLESSFFAFRNSIGRFIHSYEMFIDEFEKGNVYTSKKYINKIFEYLENDDDEAVQRLIDEGKADKYKSSEFQPEFIDAPAKRSRHFTKSATAMGQSGSGSQAAVALAGTQEEQVLEREQNHFVHRIQRDSRISCWQCQ